MNQGFGTRNGQIVIRKQALAEPVAAAASSQDQGHGRCGDGSIIVTDQALQCARFATAATSPRSRGDSFFVRAPKKQGHQARLVEESSQSEGLDQGSIAFVVRCDAATGQGSAN